MSIPVLQVAGLRFRDVKGLEYIASKGELDFEPRQQITTNLSQRTEKQFKKASPRGGGSIVSHRERGQNGS